MTRLILLFVFLASPTANASDEYSAFLGKNLTQIDNVRIQAGWLVSTLPLRKHSATFLCTNNQEILVAIQENMTPEARSPEWRIRNVQKLGAKSDGEFLGGCYTQHGHSGEYIVLVDNDEPCDSNYHYHRFKKIWKFNKSKLKFELTAETNLRCPSIDCQFRQK
jgi:hypothetical protein